MMCDADADGNAQISFEEFVAHLTEAVAKGESPPEAKGKSPPKGKTRGISASKKSGCFSCCMGKKAAPAPAPVELEEEEEEEYE